MLESNAFRTLHLILADPDGPVLVRPDFNEDFYISVDAASSIGVGAILQSCGRCAMGASVPSNGGVAASLTPRSTGSPSSRRCSAWSRRSCGGASSWRTALFSSSPMPSHSSIYLLLAREGQPVHLWGRGQRRANGRSGGRARRSAFHDKKRHFATKTCISRLFLEKKQAALPEKTRGGRPYTLKYAGIVSVF